MRIIKKKDFSSTTSRVILARKGQEIPHLVSGEDARSYIRERLEAGKEVMQLNTVGYMVVVQFLEEGSGPLTGRLEAARKAGNAVHTLLEEGMVEAIHLVNGGVDPEETFAFAEGLALTNYQFLKYITGDQVKKHTLGEIAIVDDGLTEQQVSETENVLTAVCKSRDLVNEPLSYLTATRFAEVMVRMGTESGFEVEVFNKKKIESLKMGGLLAVNRGSVDPPTFSILTWKPEKVVNKHPILLVGKGVVYDTGGLSLKPTHDSMDYMKCDMGGAAAVAGAFYAVALNRLPVWIIGLVPATDNRPDGNAYVPGDVITMYNGTTVEVLNTDAEGRLLLADALSYAGQFDPELVIELSTLTGSAHVAIDKYGMVGMGNAGRELMENLKESGEYTAERIAEFPFWDEYNEQLKSDIADLKNIGGRYAGAITAGKFLEHFTNYPYIHLDIAGPAFNKTPFNYRGKGGSGVGVRLLYNYLRKRSI